MSSTQKLLFLGATGYIGGTVLWWLLQHPRATDLEITAFVRDANKAKKLKAFGVLPVVGDNSNLDLLQALARDADVVFSIASADSNDVPAMKAMLAGAKSRFESTGRPISYIHMSGAGAVADPVNGAHPDSPTWDDLNEAQMATIAPTQLNRPVDLELLHADDEGELHPFPRSVSYIILTTPVWGIPAGPLVDRGIQNWQNGMLNLLVPPSIARGQGGMVGEGRNVWNTVEVNELADLYMLLYNAIMANPETAHGRVGLYFAENGVYELRELSAVIAHVLFEHGKGASPTPTSFTAEEIGPMGILIGSNTKCTASRAHALGWRPTKSTRAMFDSMPQVVMKLAGLGDST
ncbi:NmrA domain-containing protein [Mycena venus]|uniref:NmrA domain-containing protein n=1 Tax=Mycena venus TaxID=2733690 RepID=A0A8H6XXX3_9AGAR|nr:NmrA domain-containing protein [Mycena venus]